MSKTPGMMDDLRPIMPSLIRLLAGVIVLIVAQSVVLGFPGITQNISGTTMTMATVASLSIGLVATVVVLKFGTQLANAVGEGYRSMKNYAPLLGYFFQIAALWILYHAARAVTADFFTSAPWAYPLIFLALALVPRSGSLSAWYMPWKERPSASRASQDNSSKNPATSIRPLLGRILSSLFLLA